jgi:hypothetical protein
MWILEYVDWFENLINVSVTGHQRQIRLYQALEKGLLHQRSMLKTKSRFAEQEKKRIRLR